MTSFEANTGALRATQPAFASAASAITAAGQALAKVIAAEGKCWGGDEVGTNFEKGYLGGVEPAQKAIEGLAKAMSNLGTNVVTIANALDGQDNSSAVDISKAAGS
ncbi:hypothetical protein [Nocardia camponoti]|uniref:WXG100 family type VII secretion target n=1 Tax=Nocardia camponoti TaxID=1616106 RepID=A0A917QBC8_9NOCA|nr:hypothetical protein [Nocardia camponoti]GGK40243.1 hypothetical protein GCM10011591_09880 [Nocardia camponoti]